MSEREPKNFLPDTLTGWVGLAIALLTLGSMVFGGAKYGFGFLVSIEKGLVNVGKINGEQMPAVLEGMQKLNDRQAKLEIEAAQRLTKVEKKTTELDRRAPKKGRDPKLWTEDD